ncbi:MAG: ABC transporter substrate-binding protein [Lachnospiraceae bacterium]|nr:ABC transporter substrate-binding protein [Lachnospiraceae bacterium]
MKKIKRIFAVATALALAVGCIGFSGCGKKSDVYHIGICQLVQHPALDAATQGFRDALTELLGDKVVFDEQNAAGDSPTCSTIVNNFVANNYDLIMANATAPLQAASAATTKIPVLGTSITDYATALELKNFSGATGLNVSGTSDLAPLDQQAAIIKELFPNVKQVGILYCSAEANSKYQVSVIEKSLDSLGIKYKEYSFADSNDIQMVTTSACEACDVLYIPTDNTAASNTSIIDAVALEKKVPVVCGEEGICKGCGVATLSIRYYNIGYETGKMAYEILVNGADVSKMDIKYDSAPVKEYAAGRCEKLGIKIPAGYNPIAE